MKIKSNLLNLKSVFKQKALCYTVHNTDALAESQRSADQFATLGIKLAGLFCNHRIPEDIGQRAALIRPSSGRT
nr:hypothetical protein [uncultured Desulfobacter sp.]